MDEFKLNETFVESEEFQAALEQNDFLLTGPFLDSLFDKAFSERTYNVQFLFNPNLRQFKQAYQTSDAPGSKPILFVYAEHLGLLDKYGEGIRDILLAEYADVFDCYLATQADWP